MTAKLPSEEIIISAPFSFIGSANRIWKLTESDNQALRWLLLVPVTLLLVAAAWMFVAIWYFVMYVLFGILFIPFRLWRRSARKGKRNRLQHREVLESIQRNK